MALLSPKVSFIFSTFFYSILFSSSVFASNNTQKCNQEHFSALLHLKHGFNFSEKASTNLSSWDFNDTYCCFWEGIGCDGDNSHVISIDLSNSQISGRIDFESLFRLQSLQSLKLGSNYFNPSPFSPGFNQNLSSLRELSLDWINISMQGSEWVQALFLSVPRLRDLSLHHCGLSGPIHSSLSKLRFLSKLDLSNNNLSGSLPSFLVNLSKLEYLDLSFNSFSGPIPSSYGNEFRNLEEIVLSSNLLNGTIPPSLFSLPSLRRLDLEGNKLGGGLDVIHNASSSQLKYIYLGNNYLQGMVSFIFKLVKLSSISLPFNNFSGVVEVGSFQTLKSLFFLDLSDNNLSIKDGGGNSTFTSFPQIGYLSLRSCNISQFPSFLRNQDQMEYLDLSNNRITGGIPKWIWKVGIGTLYYLNLSHNSLQRIEPLPPHVFLGDWAVLDLSSNILEGSFQIPSPHIFFFSLSNNRLSGEIPMSICNATSLKVLDLSRNRLSGWIPQCLGEISDTLNVLNLRGNVFNGTLLQTFKKRCNLQTIDLSENQIEGQVPRSLANCKRMEVLNLGNNQIIDIFPSWVEALSKLRILILKSNKFYGPITLSQTNQSFSMLQIMDLSSNSFIGGLPSNMFQSWKAMTGDDKSQSTFLGRTLNAPRSTLSYQDTVILTIKGKERELTKILTIFTAIDLSNNHFQGHIPESIGIVKSLHLLNMSNNGFTGQIPTSLENLMVLESLDLSQNNISGEIPWQLTKLTFLSVLNLSQNNLMGSIPQIKQFLTFMNESFLGNMGLCGPPLSRKCIAPPLDLPSFEDATSELDWEFMWIGFGVGCGAGMGVLFWTLTLWTKGRREFYKFVDGMLLVIFPSTMFALKSRSKNS